MVSLKEYADSDFVSVMNTVAFPLSLKKYPILSALLIQYVFLNMSGLKGVSSGVGVMTGVLIMVLSGNVVVAELEGEAVSVITSETGASVLASVVGVGVDVGELQLVHKTVSTRAKSSAVIFFVFILFSFNIIETIYTPL